MSAMREQKPQIYGFDDFRLDVGNRQLLRGGRPVVLPARAFDLLVALVENSGRLVGKDELFSRVWVDQVVEESNLAVHVSAIRKALGERKERPRYIVTVPGHGYRFAGDVLRVDEESEELVVERHSVSSLTVETEGEAEVAGAAGRETSSAEYLVGEIRRHKRGVLLCLLLAGAVIGAGLFGLYRFANRDAATQRPAPFQNINISKLTNTGHVSRAAISPDGRYVVYELDEEDGRAGLQLRQLATGTTLQIVAPAKVNFNGMTFSRDGDLIYFVMGDETADDRTLYQVPVIGGTPKRVLTPVDGPVTFAPDGRRFAYVHVDQKQSDYNLMIANADGSGARALISRKDLFLMAESPAWSPDGKAIVFGAGTLGGGFYNQELYAAEVAGGALKQLTAGKWRSIYRACWIEDGSGIVFLAAEQSRDSQRTQLWHAAYPGGEVRRITNDTHAHGATSLGVTADGHTIVTVEGDTVSNTWTLPANGDMSRARQVLSHAGDSGISWTPDGRLVYSAFTSGTQDIWLADADGGNRKQLTSDVARDYMPVVSRDGRFVVFQSVRGGSNPELWRMDIDGGNLKQLAGTEDYHPDVTPDGRWAVYEAWITGQGLLWKVPLDGGAPVQLTDYSSLRPTVSPDGKFVACNYYDEQVAPKRWRNAVISIDGGPPLKAFDCPQYSNQRPLWTVDGRALFYVGAPTYPANIWLQPVDGGPPRQLTHFTSEQIFRFAVSPDGKWLAIARGSKPSDAVLISDLTAQ